MDNNLKELLSFFPETDADSRALITKAYVFAEKAHRGQRRESGEPYFNHLIETAKNLIRLGADTPTIAAGLLHDAIEDGVMTPESISSEFGNEILFLVEGVTKLGKLKYRGLKRHVETLRKLFIATAADIRVILIKLADRLHNLMTIDPLPREKQLRIARETLEIYAPIAHRLGMGRFKSELEDAAFKIADPEAFEKATHMREQKKKETAEELSRFTTDVHAKLVEASIPVLSIDSRLKHLYSLYKKITEKEKAIDDIYDIAAIRIVVPTIEDCYLALGIVHASWTPVPNRIKDYIAMPKPNGYQSLHTTIFTGEGAIVEVQIRTQTMHEIAERGTAAHIAYKARRPATEQDITELRALVDMPKTSIRSWLTELATTDTTAKETDYINQLRSDFFKDRIVVFTPKGEAIDLPEGATPIDFAYAIHSDLGDHAAGARINGKFSALNTELTDHDIVFIETNEHNGPSPKWLQWVKTAKARYKIRQTLGMTES